MNQTSLCNFYVLGFSSTVLWIMRKRMVQICNPDFGAFKSIKLLNLDFGSQSYIKSHDIVKTFMTQK